MDEGKAHLKLMLILTALHESDCERVGGSVVSAKVRMTIASTLLARLPLLNAKNVRLTSSLLGHRILLLLRNYWMTG